MHLQLANKFHNWIWHKFEAVSFHNAEKSFLKKADTLRKKQKDLESKNRKPAVNPPEIPVQITDVTRNDKIVNLSSVTLSDLEKDVLSLGLGYVISPRDFSREEMITGIESNLVTLKQPSDIADNIRMYSRSALLDTKKQIRQNNLTPMERKCLDELRKNEQIVITKADKGGQIVVMDKDLYQSSVYALLSDNSVYQEVTGNILQLMQSAVKTTVRNCISLTPLKKETLVAKNYNLPRFYALPKVHKPELVFRPIISNIGSPTHKLAKYLVHRFSHLTKSHKFSIKNSTDFCQKIKNLKVSDTDLLVSFDVSSMFTTVPVNEALECFRTRLLSENLPAVEVSDMVELANICTSLTYFLFQGKVYQQKSGLPMGSPLSPLLCELFMNRFETTFFATLNNIPLTWLRYVDDVFSIWRGDKTNLQIFLDRINQHHPNIAFTLEIEENNSLAFLDVEVIKTNSGTLRTRIYRKPFSVSMPPHYRSCVPRSYKLSAFYSYAYRAIQVCSNEEDLSTEISLLKRIAMDRGYHPSVIDRAIKKFKDASHTRNATQLTPYKKETNFIVLPYIPNITTKIANVFTRFTNCRTVFKNATKIQNFLPPLKTPVPEHNRSGVYQITCCCGKTYTGQTRRNVSIRLKEHKSAVRDSNFTKSALTEHSTELDHFLWNEVKLILSSSNPCHLNIRESLEIFKQNDNRINRDLGPASSILKFWEPVLKL